MQRDGQLDHAEIRPEMAARLREDLDQFVAHFLRELRQVLFAQRFDVGGRTNAVEQPGFRSLVQKSLTSSFSGFFFSSFGARSADGRFEIFHDRLCRHCSG